MTSTGLSHPSIVNAPAAPKFRDGVACARTVSSTPSKLKAAPTLPVAKPAPFSNVPLLFAVLSLALPSARHQLTRFGGTGAHAADTGQTPSTTSSFVRTPALALLALSPGTADT